MNIVNWLISRFKKPEPAPERTTIVASANSHVIIKLTVNDELVGMINFFSYLPITSHQDLYIDVKADRIKFFTDKLDKLFSVDWPSASCQKLPMQIEVWENGKLNFTISNAWMEIGETSGYTYPSLDRKTITAQNIGLEAESIVYAK
jgi:hypothetical protein